MQSNKKLLFRLICAALVFMLALPLCGAQAAAKQETIVAGYYAGWAAYSGYTPDKVPVANLTHLLYAFANIDGSGRITAGDPQVDYQNFELLRARKARWPHLRTLISVGGWEWSGGFSQMAATEKGRARFADSVAEFIVKYGFDGVDLDWEYPVGGGKAGNGASPADKKNFTLLLQSLRRRLDEQGRADGRDYLLTIAGGAGTAYAGNVALDEIAQYLDFAVIMTYDMHGSFDRYTDLNAPLYPGRNSPQQVWSVDQSVDLWMNRGFPGAKLVLGVPFYGYRYTGVSGGGTGLYRTYSGFGPVTYDEIIQKYLGSSTRCYGAMGKTPWLFNGSTFITYEDETSIQTKCAYIQDKGLAGAAIWELSNNKDGALLKALRANLP